MSGTEQQMEIDLGNTPQAQNAEPEVVIVDDASQLEGNAPPVEAKTEEVDPAKALEAIKHSAMEDDRGLKDFKKIGYIRMTS